jgi:glycosyltransferase involved in cell wall biosynthesis
MTQPKRILVCSPYSQPGWRWLADSPTLRDLPLEWEFFHRIERTFLQRKIKIPDLALINTCKRAVQEIRDRGADLLVTHDPRATWWCAYFAARAGVSIRHLACSFNFATLPRGLKRTLMTRAFAIVDRFVVFSHAERDLYAGYFNLPREKIDVKLWGVNPPEIAAAPPDAQTEPETNQFLCAIGGNRRDYATLMAAMAKLPNLPMIVVARPHNLRGLTIPPNVTVRCDIPFADAMRILHRSRFMVLPLDSNAVPCGHVTLVAAMHLEKAFIVTRSAGIADYLADPNTARPNGIACDVGSPQSLAEAIQTLWNDPARTAELAKNGKDFAQTYCSEESMAQHFRAQLLAWNVLPQPENIQT